MKRFLILAIIVLMAFAVGCSKRETPTQPVQKIEPTPEVTFGTVRVATIPDSAVVIFDGRNYGPAPVSIDSLAPAPYTYKILSPDTAHIDSAEAFYEVKAGTNSLMVRLKIKSLVPLVHIDTVFVDTSRVDTVVVEPPDTTTKTGYLVVNHNETTAGAGVWVDGSFAGWLGYPEFRDTLAVGGHNLKVHKEGFQDFATFFEIFENIPTAFNPVLVPIATPVPDSTGRLTLLLVRPEMAYYEVKGQEKTWTGTLQKNVPVHIDSVPVGDYTVSASAEGYVTEGRTEQMVEGDTVEVRFELDEEPPAPTPLMIEAVGDTVRLYGDGHGSWLGLECYFPAQDSTTGWYNNLWVRGQDRGEYTEFNVPAPYSHCVLWTSAVAGMEGSGGSGVPPRFAEWNLLQKGSGISRINTDPGYFVIQGR